MKFELPKAYIGTSGWNYPEWNWLFYRGNLPGYKKLSFYAERFKTVEINSTFYRIPLRSTYKKWHTAVPADFLFSLKLNRFFTHTHRLKLDIEVTKSLRSFILDTEELKEKLGVILIQTAANLKYDLPRLEKFIKMLRKTAEKMEYPPRFSFEFRNPDYFNPDVYDLLRKHNIALTVAQSKPYPVVKILTADFLYLRFHGPRRLFASSYSKHDLEEWGRFIKKSGV